MRALADFAIDDLFERVDALARVLRVGNEHEMHAVQRQWQSVVEGDARLQCLAEWRRTSRCWFGVRCVVLCFGERCGGIIVVVAVAVAAQFLCGLFCGPPSC
mgnify:CR=1 FL=1